MGVGRGTRARAPTRGAEKEAGPRRRKLGPRRCVVLGNQEGSGNRGVPRGGWRRRAYTSAASHNRAGRTRRFLRRAFAPLHAVAGTPPGDHLGIRFGVQSGRSTDLRSPPRSAHTVIVQRTDKYAYGQK